MTIHLTVNRELADKPMRLIDHALGRPLNPMVETYRNFFAAGKGSEEDVAFRASPHWRCHGAMASTELVGFTVTDEGRAALRDHLKAIGDKHRAWDVTFEGYTSQIVATTRSRARYSYWAKISDTDADLAFGDFCSRARVRLTKMEAAHA